MLILLKGIKTRLASEMHWAEADANFFKEYINKIKPKIQPYLKMGLSKLNTHAKQFDNRVYLNSVSFKRCIFFYKPTGGIEPVPLERPPKNAIRKVWIDRYVKAQRILKNENNLQNNHIQWISPAGRNHRCVRYR